MRGPSLPDELGINGGCALGIFTPSNADIFPAIYLIFRR